MATVLPPNPHLDHLKKQAKDLLKSFQSGDSQICASVQQYLPRFSRLSPDEFTLHDAQHVIARQYGFDNWPALRQAIKEMAATRHRSVPIADRLDEKLKRHIDALGFHSVGAYRIWCHKQGLDKGLDKSDEQLQKECELFQLWQKTRRPDPKPDYRPSQVRFITLAYEGKTSGIWEGWTRLFANVEDPAERKAFYRLLVHCEKYARIDGKLLAPLARYHRDWLRPIEDWYPQSQNKRRQFGELVRYLLAHYEVPFFMDGVWRETFFADGAWHQEDLTVIRRQQAWFMHVAQGGNIRAMDTEIALTKRMAHLIFEVPDVESVSMGLRWAQFLGMGGSRNLVSAVVHSRLRDFMEDEPFWATVVLFLANQPMLEPTYVGPIVDYIYNQKFAPQQTRGPDGNLAEGPPLQPHFTMKGRSIDKLLRQVEAWHGEFALDQHVDWEEWSSSGLRGYECEEEDGHLGATLRWSVRELCDSWALAEESQAMSHCVKSYARRCAKGEYSIWSLQAEGAQQKRPNVLTIAVDNRRRLVIEFRGKYNMRPNDKKRTAKQRRQTSKPYLHLLRKSPEIMRRWMEREQLRHG